MTADLDLTPAGGDATARYLIAETEDRMLTAAEQELPGMRVALDAMEAAPEGTDLVALLVDLVADTDDERNLPGLEAALESVLHFDATPAYEVIELVRKAARRMKTYAVTYRGRRHRDHTEVRTVRAANKREAARATSGPVRTSQGCEPSTRVSVEVAS